MAPTGTPLDVTIALRMSSDGMSRLTRHAFLGKQSIGGFVVFRERVTFYDTPDHRLRAEGITVSLRRFGRHRVQRVTLEADDAEALNARHRHETEIDDNRPDLAVVHLPQAGWLAQDPQIAGAILPVFSAELERRVYTLQHEDGTVSLAICAGALACGEVREDLCQAEITVAAGSPAAAYGIAREIVRAVPCALESRSLAQRGYALALAEPLNPVRARRFRLPADATTAEAFVVIGRNAIGQLTANEAAARIGRAPEAVHQIRVAARRLRSALSAFRSVIPADQQQTLAAAAKWIADQCGRAREWDVFRESLLEPLRDRLPEDGTLAAVDALVEGRRAAAYRTAARMLSGQRYADAVLLLMAFFERDDWRHGEDAERPVEKHARKILKKLHRRTVEHGADLSALPLADLHKLRVNIKKLRYLTEFHSSLYKTSVTKEFLRAVSNVQDCLGSLNDAVATERLMAALARNRGRIDRQSLTHARGLIVGWSAATAEADLRRLPAVWAKFEKTKPPWK